MSEQQPSPFITIRTLGGQSIAQPRRCLAMWEVTLEKGTEYNPKTKRMQAYCITEMQQCPNTFPSLSPGNRICPDCTQRLIHKDGGPERLKHPRSHKTGAYV